MTFLACANNKQQQQERITDAMPLNRNLQRARETNSEEPKCIGR